MRNTTIIDRYVKAFTEAPAEMTDISDVRRWIQTRFAGEEHAND